MRIALLGYGKMGRLVEAAARQKGHEILCRAGSGGVDWDAVQEADLCIDFSHRDRVLEHVKGCVRLGKSLVMGTTGWEEQLDEVRALVHEHQIGMLYAPNFSLGVHLFMRIVERAAKLLNPFPEYDAGAFELHHREKRDAPSGTALAISRLLGREVETASVRVGSIPGTHTVLFDSPFDTITLSHEARSREGFAKGAVEAAEWLYGKKGFYTINDYIEEICHES